MKLRIKANDKEVKVDVDGKGTEIIAALAKASHTIARHMTSTKEDYEYVKTLMVASLYSTDYDGLIYHKKAEEFMKKHGFEQQP